MYVKNLLNPSELKAEIILDTIDSKANIKFKKFQPFLKYCNKYIYYQYHFSEISHFIQLWYIDEVKGRVIRLHFFKFIIITLIRIILSTL